MGSVGRLTWKVRTIAPERMSNALMSTCRGSPYTAAALACACHQPPSRTPVRPATGKWRAGNMSTCVHHASYLCGITHVGGLLRATGDHVLFVGRPVHPVHSTVIQPQHARPSQPTPHRHTLPMDGGQQRPPRRPLHVRLRPERPPAPQPNTTRQTHQWQCTRHKTGVCVCCEWAMVGAHL